LAFLFSKVIDRGGSRPTSILPLSLRRQPVTFTLPDTQLLAVCLAIFPGNLLHWEIVSLEVTGIVTHDGLPLGLGHFIKPEVKSHG
jgi:hypothetical protein